MDKSSADRLDKVHPELRNRITQLISNLAVLGKDIRVVQGLRTFAEQDVLFNKRPKVTNARGGQSNHNYGLAVDLCPFANGAALWNDTATFKQIGSEAKKLGLEWGGDWASIKDMPHVQLKGLGIKQCQELYNDGGLPKVWATMDKILGGEPTKFSVLSFHPAPDELLEFGDKGDAVRELQKYLVQVKLMRPHEVDGDFGKITKNAVIAFQRMENLTADGIVGDGTKAKLKAVTAALGA